ncbi:hypothetical protein VRT12_003344 [Citrobacter koseri]|nr:hypothetical protein [Citrobacter koseri]HEJ0063839.1 hypothetical protein [Citrobacter koseri]HEM8491675.1 hypothetical protein [Citrobacter koseri]
MKSTNHLLFQNAKDKIDNIVCLLISIEKHAETLDEVVLKGAIQGIRKLASDAFSDIDRFEKLDGSSANGKDHQK